MSSNRSLFTATAILIAASCAFGAETLDRQLSDAAAQGNLPEVKRLLASGANINADSTRWWPPLHYAVTEGHEDVALFLIEHGAALNRKSGPKQDTPLMLAASKNQLPVIRSLLKRGTDTTLTCEHGWTALEHAIRDKHPEAAKLLREHKSK